MQFRVVSCLPIAIVALTLDSFIIYFICLRLFPPPLSGRSINTTVPGWLPSTSSGWKPRSTSSTESIPTRPPFVPPKATTTRIRRVQSPTDCYLLLPRGTQPPYPRFLIYQFAKRGVVLPLFRQYGAYFKTHRIFRQYLYTLVAPVPAFVLLNASQYVNHVEYMWNVHLNRLNSGYTNSL